MPDSHPGREPFAPVRRTSRRLDGVEAVAWLRENGFAVAPSRHASPLRLVVEEIVASEFVGRRIWQTAAAMRCVRSTGVSTLLLLVDGELHLSSEESTISMTPHDAVLYRPAQDLSVHAKAPVARFEVARSASLTDHGDRPLVLPSLASTTAETALASLLNAVLNAEPVPKPLVAATLLRAIHAAADALIIERVPRSGTPGSGRVLFDEAVMFIRTWGHSPLLSVLAVADAMHVSRQYLTKVFTDRGTTVGGEIRRHRARLARRFLADGISSSEEAAAASGFSSALAMRRVLRRSDGQEEPRASRHCPADPSSPSRGGASA